MNRDAAIAIIGNRLSFRDESDMSDFILGEMDLAQEDVLESDAFLPWFLRVEQSWTVNKGEDSLTPALPSGFLRFCEYDSIFIREDNDYLAEIIIHDSADARRHFEDRDEEALPEIIAAVGESDYRLYPKADKTYTIDGSFFQRAALVSSLNGDADNLWLRHSPRYLIGQTGMACAAILRDGDAYKIFEGMKTEARQRLEQRDMERRLSGQTLRF